MTWLGELHAELGRAGLRGRTRRRILAELADHLACDPRSEARLGRPRELAEGFAAELRPVRTRRSAAAAFVALTLAAAGVAATMQAYAAAGGWPNVTGARGLAVALTGIVILFAPQVAFVAGLLGAIRAVSLRRRRDAPAGELALVQRRMAVAVAAGAVTAAGMAVHVTLLWSLMPRWWDAVAVVSAGVPALALGAAMLAVRRAQELTPAGGGADGLIADVPERLRPLAGPVLADPRRLLALVGIPVCAVVLAVTGHAERSLLEGVERALAEGVALAGCYAALGRRLGLR